MRTKPNPITNGACIANAPIAALQRLAAFRKRNTPLLRLNFLRGHDLESAALQLRKAAEDILTNFKELKTGTKAIPGGFISLAKMLKEATNLIKEDLPQSFYQSYRNALSNLPEGYQNRFITMTEEELEALLPQDRGIIFSKRQNLQTFLNQEHWTCFATMEKLKELSDNLERSLNPAAHWNDVPLYESEVQRALELLQTLQSALEPSTETP